MSFIFVLFLISERSTSYCSEVKSPGLACCSTLDLSIVSHSRYMSIFLSKVFYDVIYIRSFSDL